MKKTIIFIFLLISLINTASAIETYTDRENGFIIDYPSGWSYFKNYGGANLYLADPYGYATVNIIILPSGGMSLTRIANENRVAFNQLGVYPYNEKDVTINNLNGFEWGLTLTNPYTNVVYEEKQVNLLYDNKVYTITAAAPQSYYSGYSSIFDEIIYSFDVTTEPAATYTAISRKTPLPAETSGKTLTPAETAAKPAVPAQTSKPSASVQLHGEKTNVENGEDIVLKLSAVNIITKPLMTVQVILIPPSGMSVSSSEFVTSGAGQYTTTYKLEPGSGKDIEVRIKTNQVGDFEVSGRIVYYYGDDKTTAEDHTLSLPIKVRSTEKPIEIQKEGKTQESPFVSLSVFVVLFGILYKLMKRK